MAYLTAVKCPICKNVRWIPILDSYAARLDLDSGWEVLECEACQEKIDLETAAKITEVIHE